MVKCACLTIFFFNVQHKRVEYTDVSVMPSSEYNSYLVSGLSHFNLSPTMNVCQIITSSKEGTFREIGVLRIALLKVSFNS